MKSVVIIDVAFAATCDRLSVLGIIDPIPLLTRVLLKPIARICNVGHGQPLSKYEIEFVHNERNYIFDLSAPTPEESRARSASLAQSNFAGRMDEAIFRPGLVTGP